MGTLQIDSRRVALRRTSGKYAAKLAKMIKESDQKDALVATLQSIEAESVNPEEEIEE